jgi:hypothetical protein
VRRAFRKEKELLGKLEYYNVKFIGYKGISYGQIITNPMPRNDKDMLYWLDKIDEVERRIKKNRLTIKKYEHFLSKLTIDECIAVKSIVEFDLKKDVKKRSGNYYRLLNSIIRKYFYTDY